MPVPAPLDKLAMLQRPSKSIRSPEGRPDSALGKIRPFSVLYRQSHGLGRIPCAAGGAAAS